jgi:structure-specific endonuclease subunit SLX1
LQVRFFHQDVYNLWIRWSERVDGKIRSGINVFLDLRQPAELPLDDEAPPSTQLKEKRKPKAVGQGGLEGLDIGYSGLTAHLEKSFFLLADGEKNTCAVCDKDIASEMAMVLVCPEQGCEASSHLSCLAQKFLREGEEKMAILPTSGRCPRCGSMLRWIDLVKELSLRLGGEAQVARFMKKAKTRKRKSACSGKDCSHALDGKPLDDITNLDHDPSSSDDDSSTGSSSEEQWADGWQYQEDDEDTVSVTSTASGLSSCFDAPCPTKQRGSAPRLGILVEDSDWDDAEVLD